MCREANSINMFIEYASKATKYCVEKRSQIGRLTPQHLFMPNTSLTPSVQKKSKVKIK